MIIVISPAKTLDFDPINVGLSTSPSFLDESKVLISELQEKEPKFVKRKTQSKKETHTKQIVKTIQIEIFLRIKVLKFSIFYF